MIDNEKNPAIITYQHRPDFNGWEELVQPVNERVSKYRRSKEFRCVYLNPAVTILSPELSKVFYEQAQQHRTEWCKRIKQTLGKHRLEKTKDFGDPALKLNRKLKFLFRSLTYTGVLFIHGELIQPHRWKVFDEHDSNKLPTSIHQE